MLYTFLFEKSIPSSVLNWPNILQMLMKTSLSAFTQRAKETSYWQPQVFVIASLWQWNISTRFSCLPSWSCLHDTFLWRASCGWIPGRPMIKHIWILMVNAYVDTFVQYMISYYLFKNMNVIYIFRFLNLLESWNCVSLTLYLVQGLAQSGHASYLLN